LKRFQVIKIIVLQHQIFEFSESATGGVQSVASPFCQPTESFQ
jgi:hypothetical protein